MFIVGIFVLTPHSLVQVGKCIQVVAAFVSGFVIAFAKGWLLTLVLLSLIPMICASGGITHLLRSKTASQAQSAYSNAATVVQQTVASIRTVRYVYNILQTTFRHCFSFRLIDRVTNFDFRLLHLLGRNKLWITTRSSLLTLTNQA